MVAEERCIAKASYLTPFAHILFWLFACSWVAGLNFPEAFTAGRGDFDLVGALAGEQGGNSLDIGSCRFPLPFDNLANRPFWLSAGLLLVFGFAIFRLSSRVFGAAAGLCGGLSGLWLNFRWLQVSELAQTWRALAVASAILLAVGDMFGPSFEPTSSRGIRAAFWLAIATLIQPALGVLLGGLFAICWLWLESRKPSQPDSGIARQTLCSLAAWSPAVLLLGGLGVAFALGNLGGPSDLQEIAPRVGGWPEVTRWLQVVPVSLACPAIASFVVMGAVVRHQRGKELAGLAGVASLLFLVVPGESAFALWLGFLATGLAGVVWLVGQKLVFGRASGAASVAATMILTSFSLVVTADASLWPLEQSSADRRSVHTLLRLQEHGLMLPGDVVVLHDRASQIDWKIEKIVSGIRPDLSIVAPSELDEQGGAEHAVVWMQQGRRILSDSFSLGGRWNPAWAVDSGPFFWFLFSAVPPEALPIVNLLPLSDLALLPISQRPRWVRMHLERARFRRVQLLASEALEALPLSEARREALTNALEAGPTLRIEADGVTELDASRADEDVGVTQSGGTISAAALAEAGDLLASAGDYRLGMQLLREAGQAGYRPAIAALARWQLAAGFEAEAEHTLAELAGQPELSTQAISVLEWMIDHNRTRDAMRFSEAISGTSTDTSDELAIRLRLFFSLASASAAP